MSAPSDQTQLPNSANTVGDRIIVNAPKTGFGKEINGLTIENCRRLRDLRLPLTMAQQDWIVAEAERVSRIEWEAEFASLAANQRASVAEIERLQAEIERLHAELKKLTGYSADPDGEILRAMERGE